MIDKAHSSVWATSNECWDDFLNDPALTQDIALARKNLRKPGLPEKTQSIQNDVSIGDRLLAYETPITEEILRQSIK